MKRWSWSSVSLAGLLVLLIGASPRNFRGQSSVPANPPVAAPTAQLTPGVQDLLLRSFNMPFAQRTSLEQVAIVLAEKLGIPVVLDRAALIRLELEPADTVQLELNGARLKTSLQLLLDQVAMTYQVVPEDNLLILTDDRSAADPFRLILNELSTLHLEIHDLRTEVQLLREATAGVGEDPGMKTPATREELLPGDAQPSENPEAGEANPEESPARKRRKSA